MSGLNAARPDLKITYLGFVRGDGGDALQLLTLAHGTQQAGSTVEILVPTNDENTVFVERCRAIGVPARQTEQISVTGTGTRQRFRSLISLLRSCDADVLHIHSGDSCLPRTMMLALLVTRPRHAVATLQSPYPFFAPRSARARFWATTARRTLRAVVSPSDHGTRFQRECGIPDELTTTIRNSIDFDEFSSGDPTVPKQLLGLDDETPIVLFSSRLDPQKLPLDAVRAFARAGAEASSAVLVFVGAGELEDAIVDEARALGVDDRVRMVGYQTNVADWLALATVWIFPTERENFSVALLEAMAAGCPILATVCPGNDEVLEDGSNALTFAVGDVEEAGQALGRLLQDPELREHLGDGAETTARASSVEQMVLQYRRVYGGGNPTP